MYKEWDAEWWREMELAFPAGHNRVLKRQEPPSWRPACRDGFKVGLLINDLPAIIRFDQRDSRCAFFVIDNSCYIAFIAFIVESGFVPFESL